MPVSAVVVTRGDVPLERIVNSFAHVPEIDEVVIWDNAREERDSRVWGRHAALNRCHNRIIYSQDDDILHTPEGIGRIIAAYQPEVLTGCMWDEWSDGAAAQGIEGGYFDLAFPGSGSVYDREVPLVAAAYYLAHYPADEFFLTWCDAIIGILADSAHLAERFEELPAGDLPNRIANLPNAALQKRQAILRARAIRDALRNGDRVKSDAHELYMRELQERLDRRA